MPTQKKHKACNKKYKALILKQVPCILKYMACIFQEKQPLISNNLQKRKFARFHSSLIRDENSLFLTLLFRAGIPQTV